MIYYVLFFWKNTYWQLIVTGEERGRILKQVINEYGKFIQVGSILLLRRPSVLKWNSNYMVTVTKSCLMAIFSPENNSEV